MTFSPSLSPVIQIKYRYLLFNSSICRFNRDFPFKHHVHFLISCIYIVSPSYPSTIYPHVCNISIFNCSVFMWPFLPVYLLLFKSSTGTCYSIQVYVGLIGTSPLSIMFTFWSPAFTSSLHLILVLFTLMFVIFPYLIVLFSCDLFSQFIFCYSNQVYVGLGLPF